MVTRFDPESVDLSELVRMLRAALGPAVDGDVVGRTVMRNAVVNGLGCSELQAERIVDTLIARGFVVPRRPPNGPPGWHLGRD